MRTVLEFILSALFLGFVLIESLGCQDKYVTIDRTIVDSENNVPIYFSTYAEQDGTNTWRPVFTYYIYQLEEGNYDAYFHAYVMIEDSVIWSGIQPISLEGGKRLRGEYIGVGANFNPELVANSTPMAYVSIEY
jgi:hypothetical protein